ncbi:hypothetical protein [Mycobacterium sp. E787]|uniref:hypothetical protein n=1 Tax=Mycobacterium sp. E787 TaxID=1834150 RepID=UPI000A6F0263|nr:hypothetical protein [Mycobacterium sp. E787]
MSTSPDGDATELPHEAARADQDKTRSMRCRFDDVGGSGVISEPVDDTQSSGATAAPAGRFVRFLDLFGRPRALSAIVVLAALIALPTVLIGFFADDYSLIAEVEHSVPAFAHHSPVDLYRFADDRVELERQIRNGPLPWFTDPGFRMHFFRPLTSLLFTLDHAVWGHFAAGYHVTSVLLYAALVLSVGLLFRATLGVRKPGPAAVTAGLAALLFAVEAFHSEPVGWISSRHVLVAAIPAVLSLVAHLRYLRDGWRPGGWLGPLGVVAALLSSETGLGAVACWFCLDALGPAPPERSSPRSRLLASLPVIAIAAGYVGMYTFFKFGAAGNIYRGPTSDPLGFLEAAAVRVPTLAGFSLTGFIPDLPPIGSMVIGFAACAVAFGLYMLARPAISIDERVTLRWLLPGALLSMVVASAGAPSPRLLLFPSIATAFLLAVFVYRGVQVLANPGRRRLLRAGCYAIVALHMVVAPIEFLVATAQLADVARRGSNIFWNAEIDHSVTTHVMVLAAPDAHAAFYPAVVAEALAPHTTSAWQILSMANGNHRFTRTGAASFRLDVIGGAATYNPSEEMFRSSRTPVRVGDLVKLSGATVTVLAVDGPEPTSIEITVDVPLDNSALALLSWRDGRLVRLVPPPVGTSINLPWSRAISKS